MGSIGGQEVILLDDLNISGVLYNRLMHAGYTTLQSIKAISIDELASIDHWGNDCLAELERLLEYVKNSDDVKLEDLNKINFAKVWSKDTKKGNRNVTLLELVLKRHVEPEYCSIKTGAKNSVRDMDLNKTNLSSQACEVLEGIGISTVRGCATLRYRYLQMAYGFRERMFDEISQMLSTLVVYNPPKCDSPKNSNYSYETYYKYGRGSEAAFDEEKLSRFPYDGLYRAKDELTQDIYSWGDFLEILRRFCDPYLRANGELDDASMKVLGYRKHLQYALKSDYSSLESYIWTELQKKELFTMPDVATKLSSLPNFATVFDRMINDFDLVEIDDGLYSTYKYFYKRYAKISKEEMRSVYTSVIEGQEAYFSINKIADKQDFDSPYYDVLVLAAILRAHRDLKIFQVKDAYVATTEDNLSVEGIVSFLIHEHGRMSLAKLFDLLEDEFYLDCKGLRLSDVLKMLPELSVSLFDECYETTHSKKPHIEQMVESKADRVRKSFEEWLTNQKMDEEDGQRIISVMDQCSERCINSGLVDKSFWEMSKGEFDETSWRLSVLSSYEELAINDSETFINSIPLFSKFLDKKTNK